MIRFLAGAIALALALSGCAGSSSTTGAPEPAKPVPDSALNGLLLTVDEVNKLFGTTDMVAHPVASQMGDHRNMLPNLNCLGVWQVNEAPIYESSHWKSVRQQLLRTPDTDSWNSLLVQSVVSYRTADGARGFFTESADRWSKCTNHNVNIKLNDQQLPTWKSGDLTKTDDRLVMPYTRDADSNPRSCQRALAVTANLIIDVQACGPPAPAFTKAADVASAIDAKLPR